MTHPESREVGAVLSGKATAPQNSGLRFFVSHHLSDDQSGDYELIVRIDGKERLRTVVSKDSVAADGWQEISIPFAQEGEDASSDSKEYFIEIVNQPNGWSWEAMFIADMCFCL